MSEDRLDHNAVDGPFVKQTWEFEDPKLLRLLDYWQSIRGERERPRWRDVKLPDIYDLAPFITVKDSVDGGEDFQNRFWGTAMTEWLRFDGTGQRLSAYFPDTGVTSMLSAHRMVLAGGPPVRRWGSSQYPDRDYVKFDTILLALDNDAGTPAHVISLAVFRTPSDDQNDD